jgi:hypothetical protein
LLGHFAGLGTSARVVTCCKAWSNNGGKAFPRFSARRRIPAQAFELKKYLGGTVDLSKISDNEHTPSSLRDCPWKTVCSDPLSVQHPVGVLIPQLPQRPEEGSKVPSFVTAEETGYIFVDNPSRPETVNDRKVCKHEVPSWILKSFSEACDRESLAR